MNCFLNQEVIIRTNTAGVWFGTLIEKDGAEVILANARRMWSWHCARSISLSGIVAYGIDRSKSKIAPPVYRVWMEAIEILPIEGDPATSIRDAVIEEAS